LTGRWFGTDPRGGAVAQLICLPHAGASAYRDWLPRLGPAIEVLPVQLPGREARFAEPLVRSVGELVDAMLDAVLERVRGPVAVFGHSMGALIATSWRTRSPHGARRRCTCSCPVTPAPHRPQQGPVLHTLPDQEFIDHISTLQGKSSEVLEHPELMESLRGVLKADYELCETYRHPRREPLSVPITALGGENDPDTRGERLTDWARLTTATCTARWFSGGHFYLHDHVDELLSTIKVTLLGTSRGHGGDHDGGEGTHPPRTTGSRVLPTS